MASDRASYFRHSRFFFATGWSVSGREKTDLADSLANNVRQRGDTGLI